MGQQQLLLLVLSTVIVGLATVAGIQAFSENQRQSTQDALVQRGVDIASEIKGVASKPSQLGGLDPASTTGVSNWADALGYSDGTSIPAPGAGDGATCEISSIGGTATNPDATIECSTAESVSNGGQLVTVNLSGGSINTDVGSA